MGFYQSWLAEYEKLQAPPAPVAVDLPAECPLRTRGMVPAECRFHPKLFARLVAEGALPMPDGGCPLLKVCKLGKGKSDD